MYALTMSLDGCLQILKTLYAAVFVTGPSTSVPDIISHILSLPSPPTMLCSRALQHGTVQSLSTPATPTAATAANGTSPFEAASVVPGSQAAPSDGPASSSRLRFRIEGRPFDVTGPCATGGLLEEISLRPLVEALSLDNLTTLFVAGM